MWLHTLSKFALGWLGWTQAQVEASDLNALVLAHDGRLEMLRAIFGEADPQQQRARPQDKLTKLTPKMFDTVLAPRTK